MDVHEGGIKIDDQRVLHARPRCGGRGPGQGPGPLPRGPACISDRGGHRQDILGEGGKHAGDRRGRGDAPEQSRLTAQQVRVTEMLATDGEGESEIEQDLRAVMDGQRLRPPVQGLA